MRKQKKLLGFFLNAAAQGVEPFYPQRATGSIDSFVNFYFKSEIFSGYSFEDRRKIALIDLSHATNNDFVKTFKEEGLESISENEFEELQRTQNFDKYSQITNQVVPKYLPKAILVSSRDLKKYLNGKTDVYDKIVKKVEAKQVN